MTKVLNSRSDVYIVVGDTMISEPVQSSVRQLKEDEYISFLKQRGLTDIEIARIIGRIYKR